MNTVSLGEGRFSVGYGMSEDNLPALNFQEVDPDSGLALDIPAVAVQFRTLEALEGLIERLTAHAHTSVFCIGRVIQVFFMSLEAKDALLGILVELKTDIVSGNGIGFGDVSDAMVKENDNILDLGDVDWIHEKPEHGAPIQPKPALILPPNYNQGTAPLFT